MVRKGWEWVPDSRVRDKMTDKLVGELEGYELFEEFLRKVDATPQSQLIEELFGSEDEYIDTPGYYANEPEIHEYSIVYCIESNSPNLGVRVLELYVWFANNFIKAWKWLKKEEGS